MTWLNVLARNRRTCVRICGIFLAIFFSYRWPLFALLRPLQPEMAGESLHSYVRYNYYLDWYLKTGWHFSTALLTVALTSPTALRRLFNGNSAKAYAAARSRSNSILNWLVSVIVFGPTSKLANNNLDGSGGCVVGTVTELDTSRVNEGVGETAWPVVDVGGTVDDTGVDVRRVDAVADLVVVLATEATVLWNRLLDFVTCMELEDKTVELISGTGKVERTK